MRVQTEVEANQLHSALCWVSGVWPDRPTGGCEGAVSATDRGGGRWRLQRCDGAERGLHAARAGRRGGLPAAGSSGGSAAFLQRPPDSARAGCCTCAPYLSGHTTGVKSVLCWRALTPLLGLAVERSSSSTSGCVERLEAKRERRGSSENPNRGLHRRVSMPECRPRSERGPEHAQHFGAHHALALALAATGGSRRGAGDSTSAWEGHAGVGCTVGQAPSERRPHPHSTGACASPFSLA